MTDLNALMKVVKTLSLEDQRALNSLLCANIRHASKIQSITKSMSIAEGDYVQFDTGTRGMITIQVTGFSRDHSKVKGVQVNRGYSHRAMRGMLWNATANVCKLISKEEGVKIADVK